MKNEKLLWVYSVLTGEYELLYNLLCSLYFTKFSEISNPAIPVLKMKSCLSWCMLPMRNTDDILIKSGD